MDIGAILSENWAVIEAAPLGALLLFASGAGVGFAVHRWATSERIKLRDEKIADYREKLEGRSPDEAKALIHALETRVAKVEPQRLGDQQRSAITSHLRGAFAVISISADMQSPAMKPIANGLSASFVDAGWKVQNSAVSGISNPPACGIFVSIADLNAPTTIDRLIFGVLDAAGLIYEKRGGFHPNEMLSEKAVAWILVTSPA